MMKHLEDNLPNDAGFSPEELGTLKKAYRV
jgi:hypothetical protein